MLVFYVVVATLIGVYSVFTYSPLWVRAEGFLYTVSRKVKGHTPDRRRPEPDDADGAPDPESAPHR